MYIYIYMDCILAVYLGCSDYVFKLCTCGAVTVYSSCVVAVYVVTIYCSCVLGVK